MIVVSPILKRVVYPALANSGYLRRRANAGAFCILTYHGVLPAGYHSDDPQQDGCLVSAENLRAQLRLLKECYHVVSPDQVRDWLSGGEELPERAVLLTCDDGLRNAFTDMAPILREEGLSCLFFVLGESALANSRMLWFEELYLLLLAAPRQLFFRFAGTARRVGRSDAEKIRLVESGTEVIGVRPDATRPSSRIVSCSIRIKRRVEHRTLEQ